MFFTYLLACIRACIKSSWNKANGILGSILAAIATQIYGSKIAFMSEVVAKNQAFNSILTLVVYAVGAWLVILLAEIIIIAPFLVWRKAQRDINELNKVDRHDLEYLLHGFFLGNTFIYKSEITVCKFYKGRTEIGRLKNCFTEISVPAPKNSWARIKVGMCIERECSQKFRFYYLNHNNKSILIEDLYTDLEIYLDDQSRFSLKLECDEGCVINENAELRITVESWTK